MKKSFLFLFVVFVGGLFLGWFLYQTYLKPKIAILYIATGRYIIFWDDFYQSAEKNLLSDYKKHYFVFTDSDRSFPKNVTTIYQKQFPWPSSTLDRFSMFSSIESELKKYDYIYFLNANAQILAPVGREIFPTPEQGIMVAFHPHFYYEKDNLKYPYERHSESMAYIPYGEGKYYVQGSFNGGRSDAFLTLIRTLDENIKKDKAKGLMAIWHDESHLNKYILDKNPLVMPPNYIWAPFDERLIPIFKNKIKIIMRDKREYGKIKHLREVVKPVKK